MAHGIIDPVNRNDADAVVKFSRKCERLDIEPPAGNALAGKNFFGRSITERLESALRIPNAPNRDHLNEKIARHSQDAFVPRLRNGLARAFGIP